LVAFSQVLPFSLSSGSRMEKILPYNHLHIKLKKKKKKKKKRKKERKKEEEALHAFPIIERH